MKATELSEFLDSIRIAGHRVQALRLNMTDADWTGLKSDILDKCASVASYQCAPDPPDDGRVGTFMGHAIYTADKTEALAVTDAGQRRFAFGEPIRGAGLA